MAKNVLLLGLQQYERHVGMVSLQHCIIGEAQGDGCAHVHLEGVVIAWMIHIMTERGHQQGQHSHTVEIMQLIRLQRRHSGVENMEAVKEVVIRVAVVPALHCGYEIEEFE